MIKEKKKIPNRFTLNLDDEAAKILVDLCGLEGRKKNAMITVLLKREYKKYSQSKSLIK